MIDSKVEGRISFSGISRSRRPYGPQEAISEKKMGERRKRQLIRYYGVVYDIAENEKGYELARLINSSVRVYGTLEEYDDIKEITVESYEVMT